MDDTSDSSSSSEAGSDLDVEDFVDLLLEGRDDGDPLYEPQQSGADSGDEGDRWTEREDEFTPHLRAAFTDIAGPKVLHPEEARAIDYFCFFYDEAVWERLVTGW